MLCSATVFFKYDALSSLPSTTVRKASGHDSRNTNAVTETSGSSAETGQGFLTTHESGCPDRAMQQDIHSVHNGQPATPGEHKPSVLLGVNRNHSSSASQLAQSNDPTFAPHFRDYIMSLASEALTGFQKGQAYDQNRPSYPPQVVDKLLQALHIKGVAGAEVLDLAAGTGKFTELLAKRDEQFQITAVEPHQDMRFELEKKHLSNVKVLNGLATKIPLPDEGVDAVIIAQVRN